MHASVPLLRASSVPDTKPGSSHAGQTCEVGSRLRRLSREALRASRLCPGLWLSCAGDWAAGCRLDASAGSSCWAESPGAVLDGSGCWAAEGARLSEEAPVGSYTPGLRGGNGPMEELLAGPGGSGSRARDDARLCHCVVAPEEACEAGLLGGEPAAAGFLSAWKASGARAAEDTRLCQPVVAPVEVYDEAVLVMGGGLLRASVATLAAPAGAGETELALLSHWLDAPEGLLIRGDLLAEGESVIAASAAAASEGWGSREETRLCHCVVAPEGVYSGAGSLPRSALPGALLLSALRRATGAAADACTLSGALLGAGAGRERCCSLSRRLPGGCRPGTAVAGLSRTSVRSMARPPLSTRWMCTLGWAGRCAGGWEGRGGS